MFIEEFIKLYENEEIAKRLNLFRGSPNALPPRKALPKSQNNSPQPAKQERNTSRTLLRRCRSGASTPTRKNSRSRNASKEYTPVLNRSASKDLKPVLRHRKELI